MAATQSLDTIPVEVKAYFIVIHAALFLIIAALVYSRKTLKENEPEKTSGKRKAKTVAVENKEITIESCEWVNSTLGWLYSNSKGTPKAMELWIASLNAELRKTNQSKEKIHIEGLIPGSLPPHVPSVYCLRVDGKMQCVTFHVEAKEFGFLVSIDQQDYTSTLLVSVIKLKGELTVQADKTDDEIDVSARFIGEPEIVLYTKVKDGKDGVSTAAVEERMKEVITKTVTSVPITEVNQTNL